MLALVAAAPPGRVALGQFGRWGAFRDAAPRRCYAIAQPAGARRDDPSALTIASWPGVRAHGQVSLRLARPAQEARVELAGLGMPLVVTGTQAWAADARADARIARLMHAGGLLEVRARDARGRRWTDRYPLDGAASAIDAMRLGCLDPRAR